MLNSSNYMNHNEFITLFPHLEILIEKCPGCEVTSIQECPACKGAKVCTMCRVEIEVHDCGVCKGEGYIKCLMCGDTKYLANIKPIKVESKTESFEFPNEI